MSRSVLVISYDPLASRVKNFVEQRYQKTAECFFLPRRFFDREPVYDVDEYIRYYEGICRYLEHLPATTLRNFIVMITVWAECENFEKWDPLLYYPVERGRPHPPELLLSWLVLTYPEIRWVFMNDSGKVSEQTSHFHWITPELDLSEILWHTACIPLFDPCGLRNKIRETFIRKESHEGQLLASGTPLRKAQAAAIDEESSYVYMNAYAAYRFGYRSWGINSWKILESSLENPREQFDVMLEDLYWNFPDSPIDTRRCEKEFPQESDRHFSNLRYRDCVFPAFKNARWRILVTIGPHRSQQDKDRWLRNKRYLKTLSARVRILYKPFAGIFDLWKKAGLWSNARKAPRQGEGFHWPPNIKSPPGSEGSHSAPGRLLNIAQRLMRRAIRILENPQSVLDAIQAATLALEAKELLAGRTPTTGLEALALQHQAEIVAESMFYGIEYNLNVKDRFNDIRREVKALSYGFNQQSAKKSAINSRLTITENLANKFRELNQFEEEHDCLAEARRLRHEFWLRQRPFNRLAWPFIKYIDFLLRSLGHFLAVVIVWIFLFGFVYSLSKPIDIPMFSFWDAFAASTAFFFTLEPANHWQAVIIWGSEKWWNLVLAFQGVVSFTNLGLLLAHLYMIISRK